MAEFGRRVAERSGRRRAFSNVTVANWESGRQEPSFATLHAIASLGRLPLCYFAGVGQLEDFPRITWDTATDHRHDDRLVGVFSNLMDLQQPKLRLALSMLHGLLEGIQPPI